MDENRRKNKRKIICKFYLKKNPHFSFKKAGRVQEKNKILVAMSGGIDSSVAAALLKKAGFNVIGVFMKFWADSQKNSLEVSNRCCSSEAENRARKVAKILKIPFYIFDFSQEFKKRIVDYFLKEHKIGNTPNPCVVCNNEIKFGLLLEKALNLGADFVATGHYARLRQSDSNLPMTSELSEYSEHSNVNLDHSDRILLRAKDKNKDQSYFLWMLKQGQLKKILFPIGDYTREEVERLARKFKLPVLEAKKSVEICFIEKTVNEFLRKYLKEKPGLIVEKISKKGQKKHSNILQSVRALDGYRILGKHKGLWFYTIGQRKGIGLSGGPFWVLEKDLKKNLLIVTRNEKDLLKKELFCKDVNWISGKEPKLPLKVKAKIRYRTDFTRATIYHLKNKIYRVIFEKPQRAITPGQSVVFYKGEELLGGGIIC
jgi:tRNA-specific 2-thiouridylase